ncbi:SubName: Full=Uncharacterized protein {ECO:0000313/EMBL:CCA73056.1} [Serendipita indica DSM 11827]|nr:SubName: Full=Uncharacterized protein {ECO:0000313/EMBL:CCA73056.1} [Serendipita indica DSM 11827]
MEDETGLWYILTDLGDDYVVPDARPDASTVLLSLPTELLQEIAEYCKFSDVHSLATVCKQLHPVAIYRLYTTVALHAAKFLSTTLHWTLVDSDVTTEDFLDLCTVSESAHGRILCGLLARQEHLDALRTLIICDTPTSYLSSYGRHVNMIIKDIISRARGLRHITFPPLGYNRPYSLHHADSGASNYDSPLDLKEYQWPSSLKSLRLDVLPENNTDLRTLLGEISSLMIRHVVHIPGDETLNIGLGSNLRHLDCRWHFYDGDAIDRRWTLMSIHNFITALSGLESLATGIQYTPQNWGKIVRMSSEILEVYINIIKKLKRLRELKIYGFDSREDPEFTLEHSAILRFANTCPTLRQVILQIPDVHRYTENIMWKRCEHREAVTGEAPIWLPDPATVQRWKIWFKVYTTAELVEKRMHQFWGKERLIPSLIDIENFGP